MVPGVRWRFLVVSVVGVLGGCSGLSPLSSSPSLPLLAPRCLYFISCLRLGFLFLCLLLLLPPPRLLPLPADGGHGILILVVLPVILRPLYRR